MGGCLVILVILIALGAAIRVVEVVSHSTGLTVAASVVLGVAFVGWVRSRNTPARRAARHEAALLAEANRRVARLKAEAQEEKLRSKMVKNRLRAEAEEERLRGEIDASLERRMRGEET
jgi:hypothetical protein